MRQSLGIAAIAILFASLWIIATQPMVGKFPRPISPSVLRVVQ